MQGEHRGEKLRMFLARKRIQTTFRVVVAADCSFHYTFDNNVDSIWTNWLSALDTEADRKPTELFEKHGHEKERYKNVNDSYAGIYSVLEPYHGPKLSGEDKSVRELQQGDFRAPQTLLSVPQYGQLLYQPNHLHVHEQEVPEQVCDVPML